MTKRTNMTPAEKKRRDLRERPTAKKPATKDDPKSPFRKHAGASKFSGDPTATRPKKAPGKLSQQILALRKLMDKSDELSARLRPVAEAIAKTRERILNDFTTDEIGTTTAHGLRVTKKRHTSPVVKDSKKFFRFATRNPKNWDLLQKTCNSAGWRARANDGVA
ncbi:MAG TPA: hypothetical protein VH328_14170, partial [Burkholderiaceae bacterium]|nr:hypothetical protein [Burkholderiaceae bacterium]